MTEPCLNHACRSLLYFYQRNAMIQAPDLVTKSQAEWRAAKCGAWLDEIHAIQEQAEAISRKMEMRLLREQGA